MRPISCSCLDITAKPVNSPRPSVPKLSYTRSKKRTDICGHDGHHASCLVACTACGARTWSCAIFHTRHRERAFPWR